MVVAGDEDAFALRHVDLLLAVVQHHLARIDIIDGIFARTVDTSTHIVVEEAVEYVLVIEDELHRTEVLFLQVFLFHIVAVK